MASARRVTISVADAPGPAVEILVSPFVIGREAGCDLVIDDPRASRRHAQVEVQDDGRVVLRDLGSANGTFVDERRVDGGVWFAVPGSFRVGRTVLDVRRAADPDETVVIPDPSDATVMLDTPLVAAATAATVAAPAPIAPPAPVVPYATPVAQPAAGAVAASAAVATAAAAPAGPGVLWAAPSDAVDPATAVPFRSSRTRGLVAMVALGLAGIADVASIVHLSAFGQLADDLVSGAVSSAEADAFDVTTAGISSVFILALIVAGIAFLAWLSRAVENAPAIGAGKPIRSPRGAIGWWFVPFANFVVPYQIVTDLHDRLATAVDSGRARPLLLAWWLTWIGGNLLGYAIRLSGNETIDQLKASISLTMLSDALNLVAAILAILVIRRIVARETARAAAFHAAPVSAEPLEPPAAGSWPPGAG